MTTLHITDDGETLAKLSLFHGPHRPHLALAEVGRELALAYPDARTYMAHRSPQIGETVWVYASHSGCEGSYATLVGYAYNAEGERPVILRDGSAVSERSDWRLVWSWSDR